MGRAVFIATALWLSGCGCSRTVPPDGAIIDAGDAGVVDGAMCLDCGHRGTLAAGATSTCALRPPGSVVCWGDTGIGTAGDGGVGAALVPGLTDAVEVAVGSQYACARRASGSVACWGTNVNGTLGDGRTHQDCGGRDCSPTPVDVAGIADAVAIAAGATVACAALASGHVVCWGTTRLGALGDGVIAETQSTPGEVSGIADARDIAAGSGSHVCAVTATRTVRCWGENSHGELGDGVTHSVCDTVVGIDHTCSAIPVMVGGSAGVTEVAVGGLGTCAVRDIGVVSCWGDNGAGQLGPGVTGDHSSAPVDVAGVTDAREVASGVFHTCARRASGAVTCWGDGTYGQLGIGTMPAVSPPTDVPGISDAVEVTAGDYHTCVRRASGEIRCWGMNTYGQLGDGTRSDSDVPRTVLPPP